MSPWTAFKRGTSRVWLHKRVAVWLYIANLVFAAVLVFPFRAVVAELNKTDLADDFVAGVRLESLAYFWLHHSPVLKSLAFSAIGLGVLYLIVNVFLAGGVVAALAAERRFSLRRFFTDAGRFFGRYFRLFLLQVVMLGLVVAGYNFLLADFIEVEQKAATTGRASLLWQTLGVGVVLLSCAFVLMVFDYGKIRLVLDRRRSSFLAALSSLAFSVRRCWRTVPLFAMNVLCVSMLFVLYLLVENLFSNATLNSMIALLVVQQVFIFGRIWMKLSFYSTQMAYYRSVGETTAPPAVERSRREEAAGESGPASGAGISHERIHGGPALPMA